MPNELFDQQNIITILGIQNLPDEKKLAVVDKISELVQKRLLAKILGNLSDDDRGKFLSLLENPNQDELNKFLEVSVPDFPSLLEQEVNAVKLELQQWSDNLEL
jgi:hypothetical protein